MKRRVLLASLAATAVAGRARADLPGVSATEIRIGNTIPYSGPASAYSSIGRGHTAFFKMINAQGGVAGRRINFITYDDGYAPPKTVEMTRRLVEQDDVACTFGQLGTPNNTAIEKYLNGKKVPQLFVATGADKWGNYRDFPWTMGWQPSYRTEAQVYAKHVLAEKPAGRIAVLYQNDDFGKDYLAGLRDVFGPDYARRVIREVSYEVTDATIDSQALTLKDSGADVLVTAATPKFAAQMIRRVFDLDWHPLHMITNVSASIGSVITPAGRDKARNLVTAAYIKDPTDAAWANDPGLQQWRAYMKANLPEADVTDAGYLSSYGSDLTMLQVLRQCGTDFSRENIMRQAANLKDLNVAVLLPGILVNTGPTNYHPIRQMQLSRWDGSNWKLFGQVIEGTAA